MGIFGENGAPGTIRTSDPQIRSLMLYPAELRARAGGSLGGGPARRNPLSSPNASHCLVGIVTLDRGHETACVPRHLLSHCMLHRADAGAQPGATRSGGDRPSPADPRHLSNRTSRCFACGKAWRAGRCSSRGNFSVRDTGGTGGAAGVCGWPDGKRKLDRSTAGAFRSDRPVWRHDPCCRRYRCPGFQQAGRPALDPASRSASHWFGRGRGSCHQQRTACVY